MNDAEETKMTKSINLVFPHQLFGESPLLNNGHEIVLIEENLFFNQYAFHKQKIAFHRATMQAYAVYLRDINIKVHYVDAQQPRSDIRLFIDQLKKEGYKVFHCVDPVDNWLTKRLHESTKDCTLRMYESPLFINTTNDLTTFFRKDKKFFFQTTFYKQQRAKLNILIDADGKPDGGQWTYDKENRKKYPRGKTPPPIVFPEASSIWLKAVDYVEKQYPDNPGEVSPHPIYPIDFKSSENWFQHFLNYRFYDFGSYEDAIVQQEYFLHHSILTPCLNVGLLSPTQVVDMSLEYAKTADIPINSTEGFIRQIIGWREFMRGMYICNGSEARTTNFWQFSRKIPQSFYDGTTGILPVDETIKKVLKTGYCHHIERLMILGNFMLLCEFDPDEVYRWFMELFIDAYDWVMVPNVYGMSQFADGGTLSTKPYIGGSNYIKKMSNYPNGDWQPVWDGLFWRFIHRYSTFFKSNPRMSMMYHSFQRMSDEKKQTHIQNAEAFLEGLSSVKQSSTIQSPYRSVKYGRKGYP